MANKYGNLLATGRIGSMTLKNRMVVTAMGVNLAESDGHCGQRIRAYHQEQAKGGVGLIIMGVTGVGWPLGSNQPGQVAISDDRFIPGLRAVAVAVHEHGAKIVAQLHFGGLVAVEDYKAGRSAWGPGFPPAREGDFMEGFLPEEIGQSAFGQIAEYNVHVMSAEDIQQLVRMFADGAVRAQRAGMDGVEIHCGHGYIISSFLSPVTNQREDDYGGSLEKRARLLREIIVAVREGVGPEFPVWCKLDSQEFGQEAGITLDHAKHNAGVAQNAGVDAVTVTSYHDASQGVLHSGSHTPHTPELMVPNAAAIKAVVDVPVIASGRIEPEEADRYIGEGKFDFLSMGRKLLADPHLPRKLTHGQPDHIRPCVYCYCCISQIYVERPVKCAVNPEVGRERERIPAPARTPRRVVVIGGGPAGMESARRLAACGHTVILLEQSDRLGGTLQFAAIAYPPNERLLHWLRRQIEASSVDVRVNTPASRQLLASLQPDAVVVATGAVREMPDIAGADGDHVLSGDELRQMMLGQQLHTLKNKTSWASRMAAQVGAKTGMTKNAGFVRRVTEHWLPLGQRIVIIGGELVGLELAEFLAHRGRQVTVIDEAEKFGAGLYIVRRLRMLTELRDLGVALRPRASGITIGKREVVYHDSDNTRQSVGVDQVIVAKGAKADIELAQALKAQGFNVHIAGDCDGVSYIEGAMESAAQVAIAISNDDARQASA